MYLFWPVFAGSLLGATGLFGTNEKGHAPAPEYELQFELCAALTALPFQLATPAALFGLLSNARPYQLGLSLRGCWRNGLAGVIGCVAFTPASYLVLLIAAALMKVVFKIEPEQHPLIKKLGTSPGNFDLFLTFAVAAIGAPLLEELLFRGVLQPWLIARRWGGHLAMGAALAMAVVLRMRYYRETVTDSGIDWAALSFELSPVYFVLLLIPGYAYLCARFGNDASPKRALPAIYGTALLFAIMHSKAWPQPIALFVLAIGLGLAAYRTQNLVSPIVMHSLFNTVAFVVLTFYGVPDAHDSGKGSEETSAVQRFVPITSTTVPESWWPRRR
jgi:membrane protease YdiL (CAAX protease family)